MNYWQEAALEDVVKLSGQQFYQIESHYTFFWICERQSLWKKLANVDDQKKKIIVQLN